jgi:hypothetical protein
LTGRALMPKIEIPESLRAFVESQVADAGALDNSGDPLYRDPNHQRISRLTRSAETRNGLVLQRALLEGLRQNPSLSVLNPRTFPITREANRELDVHDIDYCLSGVHLPISQIAQVAEIEIVTVNHQQRLATVYEIRRASGRMGYRASRLTLRKLASAQMLVRAFIHRELGVWVDEASSYLIAYFSSANRDVDAGFPERMLLTKGDLDAHFGFQVTGLIDAANSLHGERIAAQIVKLVDSMTGQAVRKSRNSRNG